MIIHTLGTSAGTQPIAGAHHTSVAIETACSLYFFDAGECCAYTAHLNGVDLLKTKAVFISHTHMDHIGGLGNLLWYIRKVGIVKKASLPADRDIMIFSPQEKVVSDFLDILSYTEGGFSCLHTHSIHGVKEGVIFDNGEIKVTAVYTTHLPETEGRYLSFAYRIECEGKTVVFSGDMNLSDIPRILPPYCDIFMPETGHHSIEDVLSAVSSSGRTVGRYIFVHNGGYILRDYDTAAVRLKNMLPGAEISRDGSSYQI